MKHSFWKLKLGILISLLSHAARADLVASVGVGKGVLEEHGHPFERVAALGYQFTPSQDFFIRPQVLWFGDFSGQGKSSLFASTLFGVRSISAVGPELHLGVGPGYLQYPDQILGGHFQFNLEGGVGLQTQDGKVYIGGAWIHASSAGFEQPNQGRDFLMVQVRFLSL